MSFMKVGCLEFHCDTCGGSRVIRFKGGIRSIWLGYFGLSNQQELFGRHRFGLRARLRKAFGREGRRYERACVFAEGMCQDCHDWLETLRRGATGLGRHIAAEIDKVLEAGVAEGGTKEEILAECVSSEYDGLDFKVLRSLNPRVFSETIENKQFVHRGRRPQLMARYFESSIRNLGEVLEHLVLEDPESASALSELRYCAAHPRAIRGMHISKALDSYMDEFLIDFPKVVKPFPEDGMSTLMPEEGTPPFRFYLKG